MDNEETTPETEERGAALPLYRLLFASLVAVIVGIYIPAAATVAGVVFLLLHLIKPKLSGTKEINTLLQDWTEIPEGDLSCRVNDERLEIRGVGGTRQSIGLDLGRG